MRNSMQLKAFIKKLAEEKGIMPQAVLQNYMLERLLERISMSSYRERFILKGGMLIAAMVGLDSRTTMDMDATLKGMKLTEDTVLTACNEIFSVELDDGVSFELVRIEQIREDDIYGGYRAFINAIYEKLRVALKIDLTTGDRITPKEIRYRFSLMFDDREIDIFAYNLETVLAEKYETIIRRSTLNTRIRDYYDIYILTTFQTQNIDIDLLQKAIESTSIKRESSALLENAKNTIDDIRNDEEMQRRWKLYQRDFKYAEDIEWADIIKAIEWIMQ